MIIYRVICSSEPFGVYFGFRDCAIRYYKKKEKLGEMVKFDEIRTKPIKG